MGQARAAFVAIPPPVVRARAKAAPEKKKKEKGRKPKTNGPTARTASNMSSMGLKKVFNPSNKVVPPMLVPQLGVFPIQGTVRQEIVQAVSTAYFIILSSIPGRSTFAMFGSYPAAGGASVPYTATPFQLWSLPLLASTAAFGGATSSRMTKAGLRITNATPNLNLGGRMYMSHLDQRMRFPADPSLMTASQWVTTFETIRGLPAPMTKPYSWKDFAERTSLEDKSQYVHVVDEVKYADYNLHGGPCPDGLDFFDHVSVWNGSSELSRPMSTLVLSWTTAAVTAQIQDLTINADAQYLTRWPVDTVPGQSAITVAAATQAVVTGTRQV